MKSYNSTIFFFNSWFSFSLRHYIAIPLGNFFFIQLFSVETFEWRKKEMFDETNPPLYPLHLPAGAFTKQGW